MLLEVCVDSVESAINAEKAGAGRVELCDNLVDGGTTPSCGMIKTVKNHVKIPVNVILRPRGGDFCYSDLEFETMKMDIPACVLAGADGVVIGCLNTDGSVDKEKTRELVNTAKEYGLSVTFHRAIDMSSDVEKAVEDCIELGVDRILTSGTMKSSEEGIPIIKKMVEIAKDRVIIMPGGGVNEDNIKKIITETGVKEIHGSARGIKESKMAFRRKDLFMGSSKINDENTEYIYKVADVDRIKKFVSAAGIKVKREGEEGEEKKAKKRKTSK